MGVIFLTAMVFDYTKAITYYMKIGVHTIFFIGC
ncbi:hypothetical protein YPC_4581 [Yersinia pestis biovar Medievalis str. Harbin 35]|nr:hypothetical protein YPC_4581 [Yersinia pestis biovar Medievalis str. Harbin 35]EEO74613.1 hypothetical protein YP516_4216 [Yersinia pestis Nepal516]EEO83244.1 hypothetical protein YPF_0177 [Yersinia pestis biovar Orientalis str. India 195]EEO86181.1 hypothetical protein YPH_2090 [Yersinia pestis biovar Orientalis str. PEXU2]EEO88304.1 hypothetical protein YPS_4566 [Yersinia pestis Pestoides A]